MMRKKKRFLLKFVHDYSLLHAPNLPNLSDMLSIFNIWHSNDSSSFVNASVNVKPEGGTPGICAAFDFSEEFLVKIPTVGPQNLVKSDQISPP